jgi:hypothetical protein
MSITKAFFVYTFQKRIIPTYTLAIVYYKSWDSAVGIARRSRGPSSSPGGDNNFHFSQVVCTQALGPTQFPIQSVTKGSFPGRKAAGHENASLYIHFPPYFHGVVLNWLSTETTLPFTRHFYSLCSNYSPQHPVLKHPVYVHPLRSEIRFHTHTELIFMFRDSRREDKVMDWMVASTAWIQSPLNFLLN